MFDTSTTNTSTDESEFEIAALLRQTNRQRPRRRFLSENIVAEVDDDCYFGHRRTLSYFAFVLCVVVLSGIYVLFGPGTDHGAWAAGRNPSR